jgi:uncharacterized Zn finger protein
MSRYYGFKPYVPVAQRRRNAEKQMAKQRKKGKVVEPVTIEGRTIAQSFWGKSWCDHLESYMDYANRLPRGRTYVRNGSVVHLGIEPGAIEANVSGSELYSIRIKITPVAKSKWKTLCSQCAGAIGSVIELLQGKLSDRVMAIVTDKSQGLFPAPSEIQMSCSCPDSASLCKHLAAVLYGVGARLDQQPGLLFTLRSVNQEELISQATSGTMLAASKTSAGAELAEHELADVFGIEIDAPSPSRPAAQAKAKNTSKKTAKKPATRSRKQG